MGSLVLDRQTHICIVLHMSSDLGLPKSMVDTLCGEMYNIDINLH